MRRMFAIGYLRTPDDADAGHRRRPDTEHGQFVLTKIGRNGILVGGPSLSMHGKGNRPVVVPGSPVARRKRKSAVVAAG